MVFVYVARVTEIEPISVAGQVYEGQVCEGEGM